MSIETGERYLNAAETVAEYAQQVKEYLEAGKRYYNAAEAVDGEAAVIIPEIYAYVGKVETVAAWALEHIKDYAKSKGAAIEKTKQILEHDNYRHWRGASGLNKVKRIIKNDTWEDITYEQAR